LPKQQKLGPRGHFSLQTIPRRPRRPVLCTWIENSGRVTRYCEYCFFSKSPGTSLYDTRHSSIELDHTRSRLDHSYELVCITTADQLLEATGSAVVPAYTAGQARALCRILSRCPSGK
jgi:hypothetical protein